MNEVDKIKKELKEVQSRLNCLLSLFPAATQWSPYHTISNGYKYKKNTIVWHEGCIYRAKLDNSGANIHDPFFWEKINTGFLLAQEQADFNATEGPSFIRNKPFGLGGEETDPVFQSWLASNPLSAYLTSESDPVFSSWLTGNPFNGYATESWVGLNYYPKPTGSITQYIRGDGSLATFPSLPPGIPSGGTAGQILTKVDATDYNATWIDNYADWTSVVKHIVKNDGTGLITKGTPVYATGSNGTNILVGKAGYETEITSSKTIGLMQSDITTTGGTQTGFVITEGLLGGLDTSSATAGDSVWLGPTGTLLYGLINKPSAPNHLVFIGIVTKVSAGNGEIFVKVQNGFELDELHDVKITNPQEKEILIHNSSLGVWENKDPFDYFDAKPVVYQKHINLPMFNQGSHNAVEGITMAIGGGLTARTWADTNIVTRTQRAGLLSTVTGSIGQQMRQLSYGFSRNSGFKLISGFNMAENAADTGIRFLLCIRNSIGTYANVEPNTLINLLGFCRLSTSNNIHIIHNDATGTATTIDLGVNFPANTDSVDKYIFEIKTVPTGIYFRIDRVGTVYSYETIVTTDIPAADLGFSYGGFIVDTAGPNTPTGFDWYGTYVQV